MKWVIKGLLEVILQILRGVFEFLSKPFLNNFSLNIGAKLTENGEATTFETAMNTIFKGESFFDSAFPHLVNFCTALMILALMIVIMIMVIELFKAMTLGPGQAEHPLSIIGRSFMASAGVGFSYAIFVMFEWAFNKIYMVFLGINTKDIEYEGLFAPDTYFSEETLKDIFKPSITGAVGDAVILLIGIVALIMIMIQYIKLLLSVLERYVLLGFFFYTSPLAFSTLASKNTSAIFKSWLRMIFSQFLLMIFGVFFINTFMMSMKNGMGSLLMSDDTNGQMKYMCFIFALYAWLLIGQKVNSYLSEIGLSAAQSAGNLLGAVTGGAAALASGYIAARSAGRGLAALDSKSANPKTALGQAMKARNAKANATYEAGQKYPGGAEQMYKDRANNTVTKAVADAKVDSEQLKKDPSFYEMKQRADNAKAEKTINKYKANEVGDAVRTTAKVVRKVTKKADSESESDLNKSRGKKSPGVTESGPRKPGNKTVTAEGITVSTKAKNARKSAAGSAASVVTNNSGSSTAPVSPGVNSSLSPATPSSVSEVSPFSPSKNDGQKKPT